MADEQVKSTAPNFNELEQGILKFWDDNKIFEKSLEKTKDGEPYIFYDGPPFATGLPHYGSILPSVLKDAIPRYQTMKGRYVRRRWGWDCHGLPIENIVEQHLKISGKKQIEEMGVERFNQICRDNVLTYAKDWGKTISRIGRWVEFENAYMTMQSSYQESVWAGLKQIWEKGLIYEDRKVLLYCSRCETPISNFEVAMDNSYRDITEESVYAKFRLIPRQRIINDLTNEKTYVLAWTTTPWTLPGNTALNIHPDIAYVMIEHENGERYILAKERLSVIDGSYEIVAELPARSLEGLEYEPLYPGVIPDSHNPAPSDYPMLAGGDFSRAHKIYSADFVTITDGTGIVHNAAMYGEEDYQLAKAKELPRVDMLDHKGRYLSIVPEHLRGVFFKDADKIVLKELSEKGLVLKTEHYTHSYPHCYRCGTPLFYNALPAWFINIQKIKQDLIENNEAVNWYPEHLKHGRFKLGLENAPDWNISRNRYWATALPFWKCSSANCRNIKCIGSFRELAEKSVNLEEVYPNFKIQISNFKSDPNYQIPREDLEQIDLHKPFIDSVKITCDACGGTMVRVPEVVDCWVESGSMPFAELHYPFENNGEKSPEDFQNRFPSDFVVEYIPQTRAWFYVMHVISTILFGQAPFKNVLTTGTILAEDGTKMSKSKNNYPDPHEIIEKYGADALRFYLLTSPVVNGEDLNFSEKSVSEISRKMNMLLYNVWSFYRMYEKGIVADQSVSSSAYYQDSQLVMHVLDTWILAKLNKAGAEVSHYMDTYDTARAGKVLLEFVNELSTWYVRRSRDRMKGANEQSKQTLQVFGFVLVQSAKLLAPFMPFLADFIYKDVTGEDSVHLAPWPVFDGPDTMVLEGMNTMRELVEAGLSLRKEQNLKVRQPLAEIEYHLKNSQLLSPELEAVLAEELNVKQVSGRGDYAPKNGWVLKETPNFKLALNTVLTDELKAEGLARELERQVQDLRKKSGLQVGDLVDVYYNTVSEKLEYSLLSLLDRKKTFVSQISKSLEIEADFETQAEVEGEAIWIGMIKI
jgi:isoleucyl-tRNA synthetase